MFCEWGVEKREILRGFEWIFGRDQRFLEDLQDLSLRRWKRVRFWPHTSLWRRFEVSRHRFMFLSLVSCRSMPYGVDSCIFGYSMRIWESSIIFFCGRMALHEFRGLDSFCSFNILVDLYPMKCFHMVMMVYHESMMIWGSFHILKWAKRVLYGILERRFWGFWVLRLLNIV